MPGSRNRPLVAILVAALLGGCGGEDGGGAREDARRPNVLLFTADDLGWKDLGAYGYRDVRTPNLDRLAEEGVRFTRAFVAAPSCSSSRATFVTGQHPHTHGVIGLTNRRPELSLPAGTPTLASMLRDAGYRTAVQGKWHISLRDGPAAFGYDENLSGLDEQIFNSLDVRASIDFIRRNADRPFYLEVNSKHTHREVLGDFYFDPDFPVDPNAVAVPAYWHLPDWPEIRGELARYLSQTERMDWIVGELLATLDELDLARDTIVVFVSDNGPPFPGAKMTLYDRGIATPLLVRWPARSPAGRGSDALVSTVDLLPTLLDAVGLPPGAEVQGRSILELLRDPSAPPVRDEIFAEMTYHVDWLPMRAVRTDGWKYIRNFSDDPVGLDQVADEDWAQRLVELPDQPWTRPRVPEELYDLAADPHEQVNLVDDPAHAERLTEMRARLRAHMQRTADPFLDPESAPAP